MKPEDLHVGMKVRSTNGLIEGTVAAWGEWLEPCYVQEHGGATVTVEIIPTKDLTCWGGRERRLVCLGAIEAMPCQGDAQEQHLARELARLARQAGINVDHGGHGGGDPDSGPGEPGCACEGTNKQANCATVGCGFCSSAEGRLLRGPEYYIGAKTLQWPGLKELTDEPKFPKNDVPEFVARIERTQYEVDREILHDWLAMSDRRREGGPGLAARNDLKPPRHPERWREKTMTWGPYADWDNLPDA